MAFPQHSRDSFFARLKALHVAAGEPKLAAVAEKVSAQRVSAWMNKNVPHSFSEFEPVLTALIVRAQKARAPEPESGMYSVHRWKTWWRAAQPDRNRRPRAATNGIGKGQRSSHNSSSGATSLLPPPTQPRTVLVGVIPPLADHFQSRSEFTVLERSISGARDAQTAVLSGLGGVGKSQLAAALARSSLGRVDVMVWANGRSREAILESYSEAATQLGHSTTGDVKAAALWFLSWIQQATGQTWMIVIDDVQDPADLQGLWPDGRRGFTIVTTRRTDSGLSRVDRERVDVGLFTTAQAVSYLVAKLNVDAEPSQLLEAGYLAEELGFLPLALAQAAAFMKDRGETFRGYRQRFADHRRRMVEIFPPDALADEYRATVAATWAMSIEAADQIPPVGASTPLLELASVLDPNGFPADLVESLPVVEYVAIHSNYNRTRLDPTCGSESPPPQLDRTDCSDALYNLARLSLVTLVYNNSESMQAHVHTLVQRVVIEQLSRDRSRNLIRAAADALLAVWPDVERDFQLGQMLRTNANTLAKRGREELWRPEGHEILWRAGRSLGESGSLEGAVIHWNAMARDSESNLGSDHPNTLSARHNLANWRGFAGDYAGALEATEQLLEDRLRVLGPDHPDTLMARNNLAHWIGEAGDAAGAAAEFERLLPDRLRVFGPDHRDTLMTRSNLARWRGEAGGAAEAAADFERLVPEYFRILGRDHPETLIVQSNLARWLGAAGDPAGAVAVFEKVLEGRLHALGPDNPGILTTRHNLAVMRGEAGDARAAAAAFEQLLPNFVQIMGPNHSHTLATRYELAHWQGKAGDVAAAAAALEQLLPDYVAALGANHPEAMKCRADLEYWRQHDESDAI